MVFPVNGKIWQSDDGISWKVDIEEPHKVKQLSLLRTKYETHETTACGGLGNRPLNEKRESNDSPFLRIERVIRDGFVFELYWVNEIITLELCVDYQEALINNPYASAVVDDILHFRGKPIYSLDREGRKELILHLVNEADNGEISVGEIRKMTQYSFPVIVTAADLLVREKKLCSFVKDGRQMYSLPKQQIIINRITSLLKNNDFLAEDNIFFELRDDYYRNNIKEALKSLEIQGTIKKHFTSCSTGEMVAVYTLASKHLFFPGPIMKKKTYKIGRGKNRRIYTTYE